MISRLQGRMLTQRALFQRLSQSKTRGLQAGFTLIELLVVIVIIGILSGIAIPAFLSQRTKAENASADATVSALARKCATVIATKENDPTLTDEITKASADGLITGTAPTCTDATTADVTFSSKSGTDWVVDFETGTVSKTTSTPS